ncbi:MAG TPA: biopolymer transporter ExbD [Pirellulales bacterium]
MSHGPADGDAPEVNMIPMIDIVIQLITFFLMLINFDQGAKDEKVRLPSADLAAPTVGNVESVVVVNVDRDGRVNVFGDRYDIGSPVLQQRLEREADQARRDSGGGAITSATVVMRADKQADYGNVQKVMHTCFTLGFRKFSMRSKMGKS